MDKLKLYEMKCVDHKCGKISLQEINSEYQNLCPYCGDETFYTPGFIEPVLEYTPRSKRK